MLSSSLLSWGFSYGIMGYMYFFCGQSFIVLQAIGVLVLSFCIVTFSMMNNELIGWNITPTPLSRLVKSKKHFPRAQGYTRSRAMKFLLTADFP